MLTEAPTEVTEPFPLALLACVVCSMSYVEVRLRVMACSSGALLSDTYQDQYTRFLRYGISSFLPTYLPPHVK